MTDRPMLLALWILLAGCGDSSSHDASPTPTTSTTPVASFTATLTPTSTPTTEDPVALLRENRAVWTRIGAVRYRMLERVNCYCLFDHPHLVAIEVVEDRVASIRDVWTGTEVTDPPENGYRTVDGIFNLIEEAINSGADEKSVKYDQYVGAPIETYIDYDSAVFDDEMGFSISDMTIWTE